MGYEDKLSLEIAIARLRSELIERGLSRSDFVALLEEINLRSVADPKRALDQIISRLNVFSESVSKGDGWLQQQKVTTLQKETADNILSLDAQTSELRTKLAKLNKERDLIDTVNLPEREHDTWLRSLCNHLLSHDVSEALDKLEKLGQLLQAKQEVHIRAKE